MAKLHSSVTFLHMSSSILDVAKLGWSQLKSFFVFGVLRLTISFFLNKCEGDQKISAVQHESLMPIRFERRNVQRVVFLGQNITTGQ